MASTVRDVMTSEVFSVAEDADFKEILEILVGHQVSALPVTDRRGRVVGVVSEQDLLHKEEFARGEYLPPMRARLRARLGGGGLLAAPSEERPVVERAAELMTSPAVTIAPDAPVAWAARVMERRGLKRLPVVDGDGTLLGIVSRRDLLLVFLRADADIAGEVRAELSALPRPSRGRKPDASVTDGVVTLTGTVQRRSHAQHLVRQVSRVEGVVSVVSELDWRTDDVTGPRTRRRPSR